VTSISASGIVFAGTPAFAVPALERLISKGFAPVAVVTQPDRQAGRGRKMQSSPVKLAALAAGIEVCQPASLKDADFCDWLRQLRPDLLLVVAYGQILPRDVLHVPAYGCWNIHASLLPRWRGAAPIQRAIEAGDTETGVCIMQMDAGLDTGAVLERRSTAILPDDTGGSLHDRLAELGANALLDCVQRLQAGTLPAPIAQEKTGISYAAKLQKAEAELKWTADAATLARRVRAFNPWPMAWCDIGGERTRVTAAVALPGSGEQVPGSVVYSGASGIDIATANGVLRILRLQRPGGVELSATEYLNAVKLPAGLCPQE
jgi:methionyl-tRNA formyltransferase